MSPLLIEQANLESETSIGVAPSLPQAQVCGARMVQFTERAFPLLFEAQVARTPNQPAVIYEAEKLSFAELNARANQLARHLRSLGARRESLVGICVERSLEMAVGILGILKSGAAYLPLDPDYPKERLAFMLEDARPSIVLTKSDLAKQLPETRSRIVQLDKDQRVIAQHSTDNPADVPQPGDLAYVIYTTGSTGKPKGVMIEHGSLANYLLALNCELEIGPDDVYLHTAALAFSSSRRQLLLPLSQGATVVIATSDQRKDPLALFELIKQQNITVMDAVPSFHGNCVKILASLETETRRLLLDNKLRLLLSASEPLRSDIPRAWQKEFAHPAEHVHMFGQTETAGIVSLYRIPPNIDDDANPIPIGRPIANSGIYILDEQHRPCAAGEAGEMYIGGAGVGRGYLNQPELTAEKFIFDPFCDEPQARLYRTGDWARIRPDGQIEFAGRRDQQIKLRGFRVELGEVETALARHPSVREAIVIARDANGGEQKLMAYVVADGSTIAISELRNFLGAQLPEYAIPTTFTQLDALPLSANGKVNRRDLPDPGEIRPNLTNEYFAPRTPFEQRLAATWCEVLQLDRVGVDDNFFELGGHSLLAAQVMARVRYELGIEAPLRALFESPTVALLAAKLALIPNGDVNNRIQCAERNATAPLSFTQQQFWLLDQTDQDRCANNVRAAVRIEGRLELERLRQALAKIVVRHEALRTNIVVKQDGPAQIISDSAQLSLEVDDLSLLPAPVRETEIQRVLSAEAETAFELANGPLFRTRLLKLADSEHILVLTLHHIICDAWSIGVLLRELAILYRNDSTDSLPQLPIQYADFARWQRRQIDDEALEPQLTYWKQQLAGATTVLDLPIDYPRPKQHSVSGTQQSIVLPASLTKEIKSLSQRENATLFMTLLAAFQTLLFRYTGQEDLVVGSPVAGRAMLETENLIGAFVNTLVLRGSFAGNPAFRDFLARTRETTLGAFSNQDLPFEKLVEELNPERKINRTPLFQVMFALQNAPRPDISRDALTLTPLKVKSEKSKFDLTLEVEDDSDGLRVSFEYNTDLFAPATIARMLLHFQTLLSAIICDPAQRVAELSLLDEPELQRLLVEWNPSQLEPARDCVHRLFEAQAARTPNAIAAEFRGRQLSYDELNRRANQLAHFLRKRGAGAEVRIGICAERSLDLLVGVLGILKAGGAYVPLDPAYPRERLAFMIDDACLSFVLTQKSLASENFCGAECIYLDDDWEEIQKESAENPPAETMAADLAYVIYTSGSTGNPKGVMIEHGSLATFAETAAREYSIGAPDRVLQFGSLCFDLSAEEIYPALIRGATVVLRTDDMIDSARDFLRACDELRVTVIDLPTAYWHELTDALGEESLSLPAHLRLVIIGGEKASLDRARAWQSLARPGVRLVNTYGPTETTVVATSHDVLHEKLDVVSIGRPIRNVTAYVLDEFLWPVPIGVPGELYLGGPGVARGYLNQPELTSEKFMPNPFAGAPGARLYKTGDLVRYRAGGNLDFLGRVDSQVKIRGFRVELGEIEQALRSHPAVDDCVVVLREEDHDRRLIAYLVLQGQQPANGELRDFLKAQLPSYMLPAQFERIEALPLTPSGKIDRRALPEPISTRVESDEGFVAPQTPLEDLLAGIWMEVLKLESIGIHNNFFELGGHSLLAARVVARVHASLDIEMGMVDVFQAPTIAGLASLLSSRGAASESESEFAAFWRELSKISDAEAQRRLASETQIPEVPAAAA